MIHLSRYDAHALADGVLPEERAAEVHAHLARCPFCRRAVECARELDEAAGNLPDVALPPHFADRVMSSIPAPRGWLLTWIAAAAAGLAVTSFGLIAYAVVAGQNLADLLASLNRTFFRAVQSGVVGSAKVLKYATVLLELLGRAAERAGFWLDLTWSKVGVPGVAATIVLLFAGAALLVVRARRKSPAEAPHD